MSDVQFQKFQDRLERVAMQHSGLNARQRRLIAREMRRAQSGPGVFGRLMRSLLTVAAVLMLAKAVLVTGMGPESYAARHAELGTRTGLEGGITLVLAPDPVVLQVAEALRYAGLRDGWAYSEAAAPRVRRPAGAAGPDANDPPAVGRLPQISVPQAQ